MQSADNLSKMYPEEIFRQIGWLLTKQSIESLLENISNITFGMGTDEIRDTALKVEDFSIILAKAIMSEAHERRPDGPFINDKLKEYEKLIQAEEILYSSYSIDEKIVKLSSIYHKASSKHIISFVEKYYKGRSFLAFELLWNIYIDAQCSRELQPYVKRYASLTSVPILEGPHSSALYRIDSFSDGVTHDELFINEFFNSLAKLGSELLNDAILTPEVPNDYPKFLLESCIRNGYLEVLSPYDGSKKVSSTALGGNLFVFGEGSERFYVSFQLEPLCQQPINTLFLFLPKLKKVIFFDFSENRKAFPFTKMNIPRMLNKAFQKVLKNFLDSTFEVEQEPKSVIITTPSLNHIGHTLWNEISVFSNLINFSALNKLKTKPKILVRKNFFFDENAMYKFLLQNTPLKKSDLCLDSNAHKKDVIRLTLSDSRMSRKFNAALLTQVLGNSFPMKKNTPKVVLSLRVGKRSCENQAAVYTALIDKMAALDKNIEFVIDGMNKLPNWLDPDSGDVKRLEGHHEDEDRIAELIKKRVKTPKLVTKCIAEPLEASIRHALQSACIISPWGAGLVKYRWLMDKSVFVFGSSITMSSTHIHKDLYDSNLFIESNAESKYFSGQSSFVESEHTNRESNYTMNETEFIEQASSFILTNLET